MATQSCAECGKPFTRPNSFGWCERCWPFDYDPSLFGERLEQRIAENRTIAAQLGIPDDAQTNTIPMAGGLLNEKWIGYYFEYFGVVIKPIPAQRPPGILIEFTGSANSENNWIVQIWRQKVTHDATLAYGEILWQPNVGEQVAIKGLEHVKSKVEVELIWRGIALLSRVREELPIGRPIGSVIFDSTTFLNSAVEAYRDHLSKHAENPTQHDIAARLGIARSTFTDYLRRYKIQWRQIRQKAQEDNALAE